MDTQKVPALQPLVKPGAIEALEQEIAAYLALLRSGKIEAAIAKLPQAAQDSARKALLGGNLQAIREMIDGFFGQVYNHTNLPEARALYRDLVDEHG